ncbi:MAG: 4-alpha-glucanotransferase [Motilibacteraceae bacterium]
MATEYWDWQGRHVVVPADTVRAVLAARGVDATTPEAARAAAAPRRDDARRRMLPPTVVARSGWAPAVRVHVEHGEPVQLHVQLEDGGERYDVVQLDVWVEPRTVDGRLVGEATFQLPPDLPLGWHTLHARSPSGSATAALVVTPRYLGLPERLHGHRAWGWMLQLYSVRSRRSWGFGDLADLADLAGWSGRELGAGFVLVNPLHSGDPVSPVEPSPYLPATRRFPSPLYIRVEEVPEAAYLGARERAEVERLAERRRRGDSRNDAAGELLDRDAVWADKRAALDLVHDVARTPARESAYRAFCRREGQGLTDFATWCALAEVHGLPWQSWPEELRDPHSPAVAAAREELADRVDFHRWLQWVLDEQLAGTQRAAREAGMPLGVLHDLAVGVHPEGADTWALQDVLAQGVNVGAPPDAFNQQGQDWSQPPWRPDTLAEVGYAPYRDMLRGILRHAGGVRVDHVLGLFRLWWVPQGADADAGTYVRYDHEALVGILALEAHRSGALVVGEDLGVVEPWVRDYLGERGILGTSILWFEKDAQGRPLPPEHWRELCLGTVTTHDLPPTAGYLAGEHIRLRHELGLLTRSVEEEREVDEADRAAWLDLLRERGLLRPDADERETVEALHRLLRQTPCRLLGVALPDAVGDRRAQNQPGTDEEYPNWRMPLADGAGRPVLLEDLAESARVRSLAATVSGS